MAFYHGTVTSLKKSGPVFRNLLIGYATKDNYGVANRSPSSLATIHLIGMVVLGLIGLKALFGGGAALLLFIPVIPAFLYCLLHYMQFKKTNRAIAETHRKFADMGYINRVVTVYN